MLRNRKKGVAGDFSICRCFKPGPRLNRNNFAKEKTVFVEKRKKGVAGDVEYSFVVASRRGVQIPPPALFTEPPTLFEHVIKKAKWFHS
jgi:hypothetical protein